MGTHNIIIHSMSTEELPFKATGECNGVAVELQTISHPTGILWKTVENGQVAVPLSQSAFSRGERSGIARWAKAVEGNMELIGKSSQSVGSTSSGPSKTKVLEEQNAALVERLAAMEAMILALSNKDEDEG